MTHSEAEMVISRCSAAGHVSAYLEKVADNDHGYAVQTTVDGTSAKRTIYTIEEADDLLEAIGA